MTLPLALDEQLALLCQEVHDDAATIEYYERQIEAIRRQIEAKQREAPVLETSVIHH
jgi:prefoldin subunit 5